MTNLESKSATKENFLKKMERSLTASVFMILSLLNPVVGPNISSVAAQGESTRRLIKIDPETVKRISDIEKSNYFKITKELNNPDNWEELSKEGTFSFDPKNIEIRVEGKNNYYYNTYFEGFENNLKNIIKGVVSQILTQGFPLKEVSSLKSIGDISGQRKELRENPEVKESQIPSPGTLEVNNYIVEVSASFFAQSQEFSGQIPLKGKLKLSFSENEVVCYLTINLRNFETGKEIPLFAIGKATMKDLKSFELQDFKYTRSKENHQLAAINSLRDALKNIIFLIYKNNLEKFKGNDYFCYSFSQDSKQGLRLFVQAKKDEFALKKGEEMKVKIIEKFELKGEILERELGQLTIHASSYENGFYILKVKDNAEKDNIISVLNNEIREKKSLFVRKFEKIK